MKTLMRLVFVFLIVVVCVMFTLGQEPKPPKKMAPEFQVRVLQALRKQDQLSVRFNQCQSDMKILPESYSKLEEEKQKAIDESFANVGLKKEEYDVNLETFEYIKKPSIPQPKIESPKPEADKPVSSKKP